MSRGRVEEDPEINQKEGRALTSAEKVLGPERGVTLFLSIQTITLWNYDTNTEFCGSDFTPV